MSSIQIQGVTTNQSGGMQVQPGAGMTEWTRERTLVLIEEYRSRPGLWDMTHDDYRKKEIKKELLEEISRKFNLTIPVAEIEKKFHTLRTQYHREISRMMDNRGKDPYQSKWFAFKYLQFLSSPKACRGAKIAAGSKIKIENIENIKHADHTLFEESSTGHTEQNETHEYIITDQKAHQFIRSASATTLQHGQTQHEYEIYEEDEEEFIRPGPSRESRDLKHEITFQNVTNQGRSRSVQTREPIYEDLIFETEVQQPPAKKPCLETTTVSTPTTPVSSSTTTVALSTSGRDECSVYGEYIANELRFITNREVLITVKHKINTALYEGTMEQIKKNGK